MFSETGITTLSWHVGTDTPVFKIACWRAEIADGTHFIADTPAEAIRAATAALVAARLTK